MEQQIGALATRLTKPEAETVSSTPALTWPWAGTLPVAIPDERMAELERIARQPSPTLPPVKFEDFAKIMSSLATALPKRNSDDLTGKALLSLYYRMLSKYPRQAIAHLAEKALETCRWFPTIAECKEILAPWEERQRGAGPNHMAKRELADEMQARLDRDMAALKAGQVAQVQVDAWPQRWRDIAQTRGYLNTDGTIRFKEAGHG